MRGRDIIAQSWRLRAHALDCSELMRRHEKWSSPYSNLQVALLFLGCQRQVPTTAAHAWFTDCAAGDQLLHGA